MMKGQGTNGGGKQQRKKNIIVLNIREQDHPQKKPENLREYLSYFIDTAVFCVCALLIGVVVGTADALFGTVLISATQLRESAPYGWIPFLALAGILIYFIYDRFGKETRNGMTLVFERANNRRTDIKLRLIPFVTVSTWLTHLFGGSAGREGVAIQIGGTIGSFTAQRLRLKNKNTGRILTITGMAAGFSGLFQTPIAAVFFAIEVLNAGRIEVDALLPSLIGAFTASYVSGLMGIRPYAAPQISVPERTVQFYAVLCIAGILFGLVGGLFAFLLQRVKKLLAAVMTNPYIRIGIAGVVISVLSLLLYGGRYSGLGTNLIDAAVSGGEVFPWDFVIKSGLTILTISAGYQGGEVTPLFAIGASLGAIMAAVFEMPVALFAALGYAAVFGAATNTVIAPMLLGAELFGYEKLPLFFAVCTLAYIANGNCSIYSRQGKKTDIVPQK